MRRAAERQLLAGKCKPLDAAGLDEGQRLEHLDRRADEAVMRGIAGTGNQSLIGVRDRHMNAMHGLDDVTSQRLDVASSRYHAGTQTSATTCTDTPPRF